MFEVMDSKGVDAFGGVKDWRLVMPSGYERGLTGFCSFVKIRVFVGISVFTRVFIYGTFVRFYGIFGDDFTQFLPNSCSTFVLGISALVCAFFKMKIFNFWRF